MHELSYLLSTVLVRMLMYKYSVILSQTRGAKSQNVWTMEDLRLLVKVYYV